MITALTLGEVGDVARFADRNHFASYNGTAPDDKGSAGSPAHCVNIKGNRKLNHAIHMIAITQIRNRKSPGRAYYDRKLAQSKTKKEALRALKRRISDVIYRQLVADARTRSGPGRASGDDSHSQRDRPNPDGRHFGQATARTQPELYAPRQHRLDRGVPLCVRVVTDRAAWRLGHKGSRSGRARMRRSAEAKGQPEAEVIRSESQSRRTVVGVWLVGASAAVMVVATFLPWMHNPRDCTATGQISTFPFGGGKPVDIRGHTYSGWYLYRHPSCKLDTYLQTFQTSGKAHAGVFTLTVGVLLLLCLSRAATRSQSFVAA